MIQIYKCLCDELRLRILNLLQEGPLCVCHLVEILDCEQVKMSKQLRYMKELGMDSSKMHREVGENARVMGIKRLFATGEMSEHTVDMFGRGAVHFENREDLVKALRRQIRPGVNLLVKGSRSMRMESVVEAIVDESEMREAS